MSEIKLSCLMWKSVKKVINDRRTVEKRRKKNEQRRYSSTNISVSRGKKKWRFDEFRLFMDRIFILSFFFEWHLYSVCRSGHVCISMTWRVEREKQRKEAKDLMLFDWRLSTQMQTSYCIRFVSICQYATYYCWNRNKSHMFQFSLLFVSIYQKEKLILFRK